MVWGVIIAIAGVAGLCFVVAGADSKKSFSMLSWIVALVMVIALSFMNNRLIRAIESRSQSQDIVISMQECLDACLPSVSCDHAITFEESHVIALALKAAVPSTAHCIHASDFEGQTSAGVAASFNKIIRKSSSRRIWNLAGWIVLTLAVGGVLLVVTAETVRHGKANSRTGRSQRSQRNGRYQSRRRD